MWKPSLHFGQDHVGLRFCSNGNCSMAQCPIRHFVSHTMQTVVNVRNPGVGRVVWSSFAAVSNEAPYQADETVMDGMRLPLSSPLCSDYYTSPLVTCRRQKKYNFFRMATIFIFPDTENVLVPWLMQIASRAPCAATAPVPWIVRIHMPPLETHQGSLASTQRAAMWRWSPPPTVRCPLEARPPSWAVQAGMSMMLVSVLLLCCVELSRVMQFMVFLVMSPAVRLCKAW